MSTENKPKFRVPLPPSAPPPRIRSSAPPKRAALMSTLLKPSDSEAPGPSMSPSAESGRDADSQAVTLVLAGSEEDEHETTAVADTFLGNPGEEVETSSGGQDAPGAMGEKQEASSSELAGAPGSTPALGSPATSASPVASAQLRGASGAAKAAASSNVPAASSTAPGAVPVVAGYPPPPPSFPSDQQTLAGLPPVSGGGTEPAPPPFPQSVESPPKLALPASDKRLALSVPPDVGPARSGLTVPNGLPQVAPVVAGAPRIPAELVPVGASPVLSSDGDGEYEESDEVVEPPAEPPPATLPQTAEEMGLLPPSEPPPPGLAEPPLDGPAPTLSSVSPAESPVAHGSTLPAQASLGPPPQIPAAPLLPVTDSLGEDAPRRSRWRGVGLAVALMLVGAGAVSAWWFQRVPGDLVVTVAGPAHRELEGIRVFVDGTKRCERSPCRVEALTAGTHLVKAEATGYNTRAAQAVLLEPGRDAVLNLSFVQPANAALSISAAVEGLNITVDGKDLGTAPVKAGGLEPGEHFVEVSGEGFQTLREKVSVKAGESKAVGPLNPQPLKGKLVVSTEGQAEVKLDGRSIRTPKTLVLDATIPHQITARRIGYTTFKRELEFSAAQQEIALQIRLKKRGAKEEDATTDSEAALGESPEARLGVLNLNSAPPSSVELDGKPLGRTPRNGVKVSSGEHSVTFIHPKHGRKNRDVSVASGKTRNVAVRFRPKRR